MEFMQGTLSTNDGRLLSSYPDPIVIPPASGVHKESFLVLHGRGDNGEQFGVGLLFTAIPEYGDLWAAFPNAKFIFPTASKRRIRGLNNCSINQWFDIASLVDPEEDPDIQYEGLRESTAHCCELLRSEIDQVGARNVVLWGLSQGSAIMLLSLLHWEGEPFAAAVGMCGWLPMRHRMLEACEDPARSLVEDDPFQRPRGVVSNPDRLEGAVACLREVVGLTSEPSSKEFACRQIPVFLGHGVLDEKVAVDLGRQARSFLETMGLEVRWHEYEGLCHW